MRKPKKHLYVHHRLGMFRTNGPVPVAVCGAKFDERCRGYYNVRPREQCGRCKAILKKRLI